MQVAQALWRNKPMININNGLENAGYQPAAEDVCHLWELRQSGGITFLLRNMIFQDVYANKKCQSQS